MDIEKMIANDMKILGISREEAVEMIAADAKIDRMTTASEIEGDLSAEQRKIAKGARQASRKPTVYKFDTVKHKRPENTDKQELIAHLSNCLSAFGAEGVEVINPEREIILQFKNTKYKLTLSAPRS